MGAGLNDILQWDGTQWKPSPVGGGGGVGTVKEIQTGTGLTGGPITATGTISIANGGVGTSQLADGAVTDNKLASNISRSKLVSGTPNYVLMNNGAGVMSEVAQLPIAQGGTGANNAADARTNLGLGLAAVLNTGMGATNVLIGGDVRSCEPFEKLQWNLAPVMGWSCVFDNDSLDMTKLPLDGSVAMENNLKMGGNKIVNLAEPTVGTDAATMSYVDSKVSAINASQWITSGIDIYFDLGKVGIGTSTPETVLNIDTAGTGFDKHYIRNRASSTGTTWEDLPVLSLVKNHSNDPAENIETINNEAYGEVAFAGVNKLGEVIHSASITAIQVGNAAALGPNGTKIRFGTAPGDGNPLITRMTIDNTGNVGIGILNPEEKLHVIGNITTSGAVKLKSSTANYVEIKAPTNLLTPLSWVLPGTAGATGQALVTDGAGNLSWSTVATSATNLAGDLSGPISNAQIKAGVVGSTEIADLSITNDDIANGTITYSKLNLSANDLLISHVSGLQTALDGKEPSIPASDATKWWRGDKTWQALTTSDVAEGTRQYFTQARVLATPLTGYAIGANSALVAGDSVLGALGKLQGQISGNGQWSRIDSNIYYNAGSVGIGTNVFTSTFNLVGGSVISDFDGISPGLPIPGLGQSLVSNSAGSNYVLHTSNNSAGTGPGITFYRSRGTTEAPTQTKSGDQTMGFFAKGFNGTSYSANTAAIKSIATEDYTTDAAGTAITFETTTNGSSSRSERVRISDKGNMGIGIKTPETSIHVVSSNAGSPIPLGQESSIILESRPTTEGAQGYVGSLWFGSREVSDTQGTARAAGIVGYMETDVTATSAPAQLLFFTTPVGSLVAEERLRIDASGNVGIGVTSPTERLQVDGDIRVGVVNPLNTGTFPAYGSRLYFSGGPAGPTHTSDNSDPIFIARYNSASDKSELRVLIGDNPQAEDSLNVGYALNNVWYSRFMARMDGVGIFNNGTQTCTVNPVSGVSCTSDIRLKENINPIENALDKVLAVNGVTYNWKNDEAKEKKRELGFIAQEIEAVAPELISKNDQGYKQVNYANFVAVINEGIKEFYKKWVNDSEEKGRAIASIQDQNVELQERVERLESENRELKKAVCEINPNAEICKK